MNQFIMAHPFMHGATSVCLWPRSGNKDKLASSPSDDDEHSAQWDACDI